MAKNAKAQGKRRHHCPPFPDGWTKKFTGPAWDRHDTVEAAQAKWAAYLKAVGRLRPCPSQAGKGESY